MAHVKYRGGYSLPLAENSGPLYNDYIDDAKYYEELREATLNDRAPNPSAYYITSRQRSIAHTEDVIHKQTNIQMTTKVITIAEMYKLIPETMKIKNQEATGDLKDTLSNVIKFIEQSGEWEFVQYIPKSGTNLALIIVRENHLMNKAAVSGQAKSAWATIEPIPQDLPREKEVEAHYTKNSSTGSKVSSEPGGKPEHLKLPWE